MQTEFTELTDSQWKVIEKSWKAITHANMIYPPLSTPYS